MNMSKDLQTIYTMHTCLRLYMFDHILDIEDVACDRIFFQLMLLLNLLQVNANDCVDQWQNGPNRACPVCRDSNARVLLNVMI